MKYMTKVVNLETGEEIERPMTDDEIAQFKADVVENDALQAIELEKIALRESRDAKLIALGLTADELNA